MTRARHARQEAVAAIGRGDYAVARSLLEALLADVKGRLYPQHAICYNVQHRLLSACNSMGDTEDAAAAGWAAVRCLEAVYPPAHSEVASLYNALGKTEWATFVDGGSSNTARRGLYLYLGSIYSGPLTGVTIGYYPTIGPHP